MIHSIALFTALALAAPTTPSAEVPGDPTAEPTADSTAEPIVHVPASEASNLPRASVARGPNDSRARVGGRRQWRGIGLMTVSGALGLGWLGTKLVVTANDPRTAREIERDPSSARDCVESCYNSFTFHLIGAPLLVGSMAFLGGGLHVYGRWRGETGRRSSLSPGAAAGLGAGALLGGALTLVATQVAARGNDDHTQSVALLEVGWWSAGILGLTGAGMLGYSHGLERGRRRPRLSVAPTMSRTFMGLGVSGRF